MEISDQWEWMHSSEVRIWAETSNKTVLVQTSDHTPLSQEATCSRSDSGPYHNILISSEQLSKLITNKDIPVFGVGNDTLHTYCTYERTVWIQKTLYPPSKLLWADKPTPAIVAYYKEGP